MINISIAGDFVPRERVALLIDSDRHGEIFSEVRAINERMDYRIVNLECPVATSQMRCIKKAGPVIGCREQDLYLLTYGLFDCVTLANNHFFDYGEEGVENTLRILSLKNIDHVGGGRNLSEASATLYKDINGERLAIVNCCEHEFSIASDIKGGSNPIDPVDQYRAITEARQKADHVIVITHGGVEFYQYPTPRMQKTYRYFIDIGADAVINHHQHCISGMETYKARPIFYGLGNFCFDRPKYRNHSWNKGYLVCLQLDKRETRYEIHPYEQCNETPQIKMLKGEELQESLAYLEKLNLVIGDKDLLIKEHQKWMNRHAGYYTTLLSPYASKWASWLCQKGLLPAFYPQKKWITLLNLTECESHRERWIHFIRKKIHQ